MTGRHISHTEEWWATASPTTIRCAAHYKSTGLPCRREALIGSNVCAQHGALAPQVVAAAAVRLQMTADEAARQLISWMGDSTVEMRERVKIAQDLLSRAGLAGSDKLLVHVQVDPIEKLFRGLLAKPDGFLADADYEQAEGSSLDARQDLQDRLEGANDVEYEDVPAAPDDGLVGEPSTRRGRLASRAPSHLREGLRRLI